MTSAIKKASTVQEAQWACELTPLQGGDERWVDFSRNGSKKSQRLRSKQ